MKKILSVLLCLVLVVSLFAACGGGSTPDPTPAPAPAATPAPADTGGDDTPEEPQQEVKRIAAIMNTVGVNPFLTQVVDELAALYASGQFPMEYTIIECGDIAAFGENIRASVEEGYDLIISVGFQGADAIAEISQMFPDRARFAIIDTIADSPYVTSVTFNPAEAAYLIGIIAAMVSADQGQPNGPFGAVHANPGQGSFEWRYGLMRGVMSINPDVTTDDFIFNYTRSFTDAALAKELALQQAAQGAIFINAASAVADFGTFEAAQEVGFFTSGQDADRTTPDNPNVLTTQLKYTGMATRMIVEAFFNGTLEPGVTRLGLQDGGVGAAHITSPGLFRNYEILTDEIIEAARRGWEDILAGRVSLSPVPLEEDFMGEN